MRNRPKSEPVDPTPPMPRGETDFEEAQMRRDFLAVFLRISKAMFHSIQESHEYSYRAGFSAGKARRKLEGTITSPKLPTFIQIL